MTLGGDNTHSATVSGRKRKEPDNGDESPVEDTDSESEVDSDEEMIVKFLPTNRKSGKNNSKGSTGRDDLLGLTMEKQAKNV